MNETQTADQRLEELLQQRQLRDPREFFRERLRLLKERDRAAFQRALDHYDQILLPNVAAAGADVRLEWLDYGRLLAELSGAGRIIVLDQNGRAGMNETPDDDALVLHVPDDEATPVLVLS